MKINLKSHIKWQLNGELSFTEEDLIQAAKLFLLVNPNKFLTAEDIVFDIINNEISGSPYTAQILPFLLYDESMLENVDLNQVNFQIDEIEVLEEPDKNIVAKA